MCTYRILLFALFAALATSGCVSKKKYMEALRERDEIHASHERAETALDECESRLLTSENNLGHARSRINSLEQEMAYFKSTNTNLLDRLADLSVVSKSGAENIRESLEALNEQNRYIRNLTTSMRQKDSINLVLVMNLKRSLADVADEDVTIEVKKGVVYISLSDKMLFKTASAQIQPAAEAVLGKIAQVVNDHKDLDILVEGHTDNVPIRNECMYDNWDLSVKRATSVTRLLQEKYGVKPARMTAGGRGEYLPKAGNDTDQGRSLNRRTEIIILPQLDQFFRLLEPVAEQR